MIMVNNARKKKGNWKPQMKIGLKKKKNQDMNYETN